jgi:hypothetical protein
VAEQEQTHGLWNKQAGYFVNRGSENEMVAQRKDYNSRFQTNDYEVREIDNRSDA